MSAGFEIELTSLEHSTPDTKPITTQLLLFLCTDLGEIKQNHLMLQHRQQIYISTEKKNRLQSNHYTFTVIRLPVTPFSHTEHYESTVIDLQTSPTQL